jgi:hypothetical protein
MPIINPLTIPRGDRRYMRIAYEVECEATDAVNDWVYIKDDLSGQRWVVEKADIYDRTKMPAIGVLIEKTTSTTGLVQVIGRYDGFSGLDYTKLTAWLGSSGIQYTLPTPGPSDYAIVQRIGKPIASDVFWIAGSLELYEVVT